MLSSICCRQLIMPEYPVAHDDQQNQSKNSENLFFPIRINSLFPAHPPCFDIYLKLRERYVLYLRAGDPISPEKIQKLDAYSTYFYVQEQNRGLYKKYISLQLNNDHLNPQDKAMLLRESSYALVSELFENPDVTQALKDSKEMIDHFVHFMEDVPEGMAHMISLSSHDFYTYNHSLDVSIYSLGLGKAAGMSKEEITELGQGSLFHDIGKRYVSADIICKDGPLDDIEWAQMQKHPTFGLQILEEQDDISEAIKASAFEHHENFLGTGYPQGLDGDEIHPFARIIALTDTYDAMTTQRSYNTPMTPRQALTMIKDKLADRYDPDFLKAFHSILFQLEGR